MPTEKPSFKYGLFRKTVGFSLAGLIVWYLSGDMGFPIWWQIEFAVFVGVGLLLFIILDLPSLSKEKLPSQTNSRILISICLPAILFFGLTASLPQYEKGIEGYPDHPPWPTPAWFITEEVEPEEISAGREVFEGNKCLNCHKVFSEGKSDIGPNLGNIKWDLYSREYIQEQIFEPEKNIYPGFENTKPKDAMPIYYSEDLNEKEVTALVSYLKSLPNSPRIPVNNKQSTQILQK